jgi:hypothetical protein
MNGMNTGKNLASEFKPLSQGAWELKLIKPIQNLPDARVVVSIKDKQGNITRISRAFSVGKVRVDSLPGS